jgi:uncharacterized membrane protein YebE (DUF533 family)
LGSTATVLLASPLARAAAGGVIRLGIKAAVLLAAANFAIKAGRAVSDSITLQAPDIKRARIRAAIAAARADGVMTLDERNRVLAFADRLGVDPETRDGLLHDMESGVRLEDITSAAPTPRLASQLYRDALTAVDPREPGKRPYLNRLTSALNIGFDEARRIEDEWQRRSRPAA